MASEFAGVADHGGEIEKGERKCGVPRGSASDEGAVAAAHVDQMPVLAEIVGCKDLAGHGLLRGGHELRIGACLLGPRRFGRR